MGKYSYDILRETWIYQDIRTLVQTEAEEHYLQEQRQTALSIVEIRFPRLLSIAQTALEQITDGAQLRQLIIQVGTARIEKEARSALSQ